MKHLFSDETVYSSEVAFIDEMTSSSIIQQDSWLLSFIDILTLLLTLFVLLLAYKNDGANDKNFPNQTVQENITKTETTLMPALFPPTTDVLPIKTLPIAVNIEADPATNNSSPETSFLKILSDNNLHEHFEISAETGIINLELSDDILFKPASAALTEDGVKLLTELAKAINLYPYEVSVEGHTDNVPIKTAQFPSNWDLSATRATVVTRLLITQGVSSRRLHAIAFGDTRPRADNDTEEGRTKNRRVSLLLQLSSGNISHD